MDPRLIDEPQWEQLGRAMISFYLFVALGLTGGLAVLLSSAVVTSLQGENGGSGAARLLRRGLSPAGWLALGLAIVALIRGLYLAVGVLLDVYPRFLI